MIIKAAKFVIIYVRLLNEGTDVWRPIEAEPLPDGRYKIVSEMPPDEDWAVPPGAVVECRRKVLKEGGICLEAMETD